MVICILTFHKRYITALRRGYGPNVPVREPSEQAKLESILGSRWVAPPLPPEKFEVLDAICSNLGLVRPQFQFIWQDIFTLKISIFNYWWERDGPTSKFPSLLVRLC